jgi:hypothetical protein
MLYLTLLSPVLAFPALLFMEWLERWTMATINGRPSERWPRREKPETVAPQPRRSRERAGRPVRGAPLDSGLGGR